MEWLLIRSRAIQLGLPVARVAVRDVDHSDQARPGRCAEYEVWLMHHSTPPSIIGTLFSATSEERYHSQKLCYCVRRLTRLTLAHWSAFARDVMTRMNVGCRR
jgi:hypothetical protein